MQSLEHRCDMAKYYFQLRLGELNGSLGIPQPISGKAETQTCISDFVACALSCSMWDLVGSGQHGSRPGRTRTAQRGVAAKA